MLEYLARLKRGTQKGFCALDTRKQLHKANFYRDVGINTVLLDLSMLREFQERYREEERERGGEKVAQAEPSEQQTNVKSAFIHNR